MKTMMLTKFNLAMVVLLTVGLLGAVTGWLTPKALADKPDKTAAKAKSDTDKKANTELSGVVQQVDLVRNTLVFASRELAPVTLAITMDAKVVVDDGTGDKFGFRDGKLADLTDGLAVTLRLTPDREGVVAIWIEGVTVQGVLKAVDAANDRITALVQGSKREPAVEKTFQVAPGVKIAFVDGPEKRAPTVIEKLDDLPTGAAVTLKLSGDQKTVGTIWAQGQNLSGALKAIDGVKNTITIGAKEGDKTIELAKDVKISIDDGKGEKAPQKQAKLADLAIGGMVTMRLSLDQKTVVAVHAEAPSIDGVLKAVDAAKNTITVTVMVKGAPAMDRTFEVAKDARIHIGGKLGKQGNLADLAAGAQVVVKLSADMKTVVAIQGS
jgi:hypothetical protein